MNKHLLMADDDIELCEMLTEYLELDGFTVTCVHDGAQAIETLKNQTFDLLILDVMMPHIQGFDVLRDLRKSSGLPVIMLTARGDDMDRIIGLELGADDYMPKPCNPRELSARIRAVLRRSDERSTQPQAAATQAMGIELDQHASQAQYQGNSLNLTRTEYALLEYLVSRSGKLCTKEELSLSALGKELQIYDRSLDMHISNLRKKLDTAGLNKDQIKNLRGRGYQWSMDTQ